MVRFPSKTNTLRFLREAGVPVGTVIDIGVEQETHELRQVFPDRRHILFEPVAEFHEAIRRNYAGMDYFLVPAAASDEVGTGRLHKFAIEGKEVTHARLVEGSNEEKLETVATLRLDNFLKGRNELKPYLLKLDVDGSELPVMRGCEGIWDDIGCVVIEVNAFNIAERLNFLIAKDFRLFDIVDQCYYYGLFVQADFVFVANKLMDNENLKPWETRKFSWEGWLPVANLEPREERTARAGKRGVPAPALRLWQRLISRLAKHRKGSKGAA